ncbi:hypothetical protein QYM36_016466 [Artemia franciscana]|uniref:RNA-directed DNA polymerase n=1 Tax=Artemia franciscana TaxID=6661 RepID=A0AA88L3G0_ARTSF|nr:hypothetical protein QYM36_016466 [Artemia franciscana]
MHVLQSQQGHWPRRDESTRITLLSVTLLSAYTYEIKFIPSTAKMNADVLSRLELTTESGCILRNERVIIPPVFQNHVINELHQGHPGMVRMKSLARIRVWWPNIADDIEKKVRSCSLCQLQQSSPAAFNSPWPKATRVWERVHIDFAGPFYGKIFMIVTDTFSKWIEVILMNSMSSTASIEALGDAVLVREYASPDSPVWVQGVILKCVPSIIYLGKVNDYVWKRHIHQMRDCTIKDLPIDTDWQTLVKCPLAERNQVARSRVEPRRSDRERKLTQFYGMNYIKEGENAVF